jgi:hypothetical protein
VTGPDERRAELAARLARVRARIADACRAVGRDPAEVTLVAVTKTYPADDVLRLAELGVRDIGENRDQEAAPKAAAVAASGVDVRWHFVGQLQRNKCRSVARYAYAVHSVDRLPLVDALARASDAALDAGHRRAPVEVLLQLSLDGDPSRGGARREELGALADAVAAQPALRLAGLMAVAPLDWAPERAFALLADAAAEIRAAHPEATALSAGMSGDLEAAVAHGATHVRIGSALLGNRPPVR